MFGQGRDRGSGGSFDWLHNVGEDAVRLLAGRLGDTMRTGKNDAAVAESRIGETRVVLAVPLTFMNESGRAAASLVKRFRFTDPERIIVVHDELDIDFTTLRIKKGGGDGGHNGLKSIRSAIGTGDYFRIRLGIGRPVGRQAPADYVLQAFSSAQRAYLPAFLSRCAEAAETLIRQGLDVAQNAYNERSSSGDDASTGGKG